MFNALKSSTRTQPRVLASTGLPNRISTKATRVRFMQQGVPGGSQQEKSSMEQKPNNNSSNTTDSMSSLGEAYASRSDEEGFGGVYGKNQYLNKEDEHIMDGKTTSNDASQGSLEKEEAAARNQK
ncbi:hypothetical protein LIER_30044 [Lithospermum erythrorhizon]|uniref:Uncharacterized protein n=1 Tax=Lithospermum erythrorhizon TaxID=34254 RepID=A0AAV3RLN3_LITER